MDLIYACVGRRRNRYAGTEQIVSEDYCRRHLPQCKWKTAASGYKGGNEHGGNCLYALGKMSFASPAQRKLNNEGFSEQSIPSGNIVGSLYG